MNMYDDILLQIQACHALLRKMIATLQPQNAKAIHSVMDSMSELIRAYGDFRLAYLEHALTNEDGILKKIEKATQTSADLRDVVHLRDTMYQINFDERYSEEIQKNIEIIIAEMQYSVKMLQKHFDGNKLIRVLNELQKMKNIVHTQPHSACHAQRVESLVKIELDINVLIDDEIDALRREFVSLHDIVSLGNRFNTIQYIVANQPTANAFKNTWLLAIGDMKRLYLHH